MVKKKTNLPRCCFSSTNALEYLIQTFVGLEWFVCKKCTNQPHCCFQRHKCTGIPNTNLWWPRMVCLQQMHKSTSLLLSAAQALWNAYCFPGLAGLRLFVGKRKKKKKKTSLLRCCFQRHKCTRIPSTNFVGLEWFVCNKCTNQTHCCFQRHKHFGMPTVFRA